MTLSSESSCRVLIVDGDADDLAELATGLRNRGFAVAIASSVSMACSRAATHPFDAILVAEDLAHGANGLVDALELNRAGAPPYLVLVVDSEMAWGEKDVHHRDIDGIGARIQVLTAAQSALRPDFPGANEELSPASTQVGSLVDTPLLNVVDLLWRGKRSGTLTVTTAAGAGELRFARGELVDAVYLKLEGTKALLRVLGESEGTYVFTLGTPIVMRRITTPSEDILRDARRALDETRLLLRGLGDLAGVALVTDDAGSSSAFPKSSGLSPVARALSARLHSPVVLEEILDHAAEPDVEVLRALAELDSKGRLRRIRSETRRLRFVAAEQTDRIQALSARARAAGFLGPARVVLAATEARLARLTHSALCLEEACPAAHPAPSVPAPHEMTTLRLSEGVSVEIYGLPLVPAYAPLWPMALAGAQAVVRLDDAAAEVLAEVCGTLDISPLDAQMLVGAVDEGDAEHVGNLVRAALGAV